MTAAAPVALPRPHLAALGCANALHALARQPSPVTLSVARVSLGTVLDVWAGSGPIALRATSQRGALESLETCPDARELHAWANEWHVLAGTLAARVGARLPAGTVTVR